MNKLDILPFLKELTNDVENEKLNDKQMECIGNFKNMFKFMTEISNTGLTINELKEEDYKDFFKFLIVGCYIYKLCNIPTTKLT
jgi:hypothetical protein